MNLITFAFDVVPDEQSLFVNALEKLRTFWDEKGITVSLFRDANHTHRFLQVILTDHEVEDITSMIQEEESVRDVFELMKESQGRVVVSFYHQIV